MPTIIQHETIPFKRGYYSKIFGRQLITAENGAKTCAVWEQKIPPDGYIIAHTHPFEETITFLTGEVKIMIDHQTHHIKAPTTLFIPPNVVHSITNQTGRTAHLFAFLATNNPTVIYQNQPQPVNWNEPEI